MAGGVSSLTRNAASHSRRGSSNTGYADNVGEKVPKAYHRLNRLLLILQRFLRLGWEGRGRSASLRNCSRHTEKSPL